MPYKKINIIAIVLIMIASFLWSCKDQNTKQPDMIDKTVSIGIAQTPLSTLVIIAFEKGFFKRNGLKITEKTYPSGKRALQGMFNGEVNIVTTAEVPVVFNSFERNDFSIFATLASSENHPKIIARRDSGIHEPGDLKGKRIATQKASAVHFFLHMFLLNNGLSEKDVRISFLKAEELSHALVRGDIDAFSMRAPFIGIAKAELGGNAVIFEEPGLYRQNYNIAAHNKFIHNNRDIIERILKALLDAEEFTMANPDHATAIVAKRIGISEIDANNLITEYDFRVTLNQSLVLEMEDEAKWIVKHRFVDEQKAPNYLDFIYPDALKTVKPEAVRLIY